MQYDEVYGYTFLGQFVQSRMDYKRYSVTTTYDLAGNPDVMQLWEGEPGSGFIKALDYDAVTGDTEDAMSSAVLNIRQPGKVILL